MLVARGAGGTHNVPDMIGPVGDDAIDPALHHPLHLLLLVYGPGVDLFADPVNPVDQVFGHQVVMKHRLTGAEETQRTREPERHQLVKATARYPMSRRGRHRTGPVSYGKSDPHRREGSAHSAQRDRIGGRDRRLLGETMATDCHRDLSLISWPFDVEHQRRSALNHLDEIIERHQIRHHPGQLDRRECRYVDSRPAWDDNCLVVDEHDRPVASLPEVAFHPINTDLECPLKRREAVSWKVSAGAAMADDLDRAIRHRIPTS